MNTKTIIGFVLVTILVLVGSVTLLWKFGNTEGKVIADAAGKESHVKGEGSVTIVEFSDLQCPACQAVQAPLQQLMSDNQGKVRLVYRHFPLTTIHKNALSAAWATEAADKQGKFWEMHDLLFSRQKEWEKEADPKDKYAGYATELKLDKDKFLADFQSQEVKDAVNADNLDATRFALSGTPTFFVNGVKTDFNLIQAKIAELTK